MKSYQCKSKNTSKTHQGPSHQQVSHVFVWTKKNVRSSALLADMDAMSLQLQEQEHLGINNNQTKLI